jgi:hypothetical protein
MTDAPKCGKKFPQGDYWWICDLPAGHEGRHASRTTWKRLFEKVQKEE